MSAAYRSHSNTTYATRTNTTITAPSGITDGDILLLFFFGFNLTSVTLPTGFTQLSGSPVNNAGPFSTYIAYKVASGESGDYTVTHGSLSTQGAIVVVSGGDTTNPPTCTFNTGTGSTSTALAVTLSAANGLVVFAGAGWDGYGSSNPPSGTTPTFTERVDTGEMYLATGPWASSGSTGDKSQLPNGSNFGNPWTAMLVKVEVSGGGASVGAPYYYHDLIGGGSRV